MPTNDHASFLEEEYERQRAVVVRFLREHRGNSTRNQLIKGMGFVPPLDRLIKTGIIRTYGPFNHIELVE